jgi:hypothetical protein
MPISLLIKGMERMVHGVQSGKIRENGPQPLVYPGKNLSKPMFSPVTAHWFSRIFAFYVIRTPLMEGND